MVFAGDRDGPQSLYVKTVDDAAPEQVVYHSEALFKNPSAWSPDGQWFELTQLDPGSAQNVYRLPATGEGELKTLVHGPARDIGGPISLDGKWLAYTSDETGRYEVYVRPFLDPGPRVQVSQQGGAGSWWTRDGRQLVYVGADLHSLWRADVEPGKELRVSQPRQIATLPSTTMSVDASPDRQRFLVIAPERTGIGSIMVVQHWCGGAWRSSPVRE